MDEKARAVCTEYAIKKRRNWVASRYVAMLFSTRFEDRRQVNAEANAATEASSTSLDQTIMIFVDNVVGMWLYHLSSSICLVYLVMSAMLVSWFRLCR